MDKKVPRYLGWAWVLVLGGVAGVGSAAVDLAGASGRSNDVVTPGSRVAAVRERSYQMNARVRPFLFWIRKTDVGEGRITWREQAGVGRGYDLLVGSDPARTPRRINRWGFIREELSPTGASVVGVMKHSKEESIKDAEEQLAREGQGDFVFEAIRTRIAGGRADAGVVSYRSPVDLTYRDVGPLLTRVTALDGPRRTAAVPASTWPGLLFAVADIVHETASSPAQAHGAVRLPQPRRYLYNTTLYDLRLRSLEPASDSHGSGAAMLDADFEIFNQKTRNSTRFSIRYARTGPAAEVPVKITFRPRWWFEVELVLRADDTLPGRLHD